MPQHELDIVSNGGRVEYGFWSTGAVTDISLESHEEITEKHVHGSCVEHTDTIGFNGDAMDFVCHEGFKHMTLRLDGQQVNIAHLKMGKIDVESSDGGLASYGLSSSGKMVRPANVEDNDTRVAENRFRGEVTGGTDTYAYQGGLTNFWCNSDCDVTINGETITIKGNPPAGARF